MENNPEQHQGEQFRRQLKATGREMNDIAESLGMTRQNLNYHLRKEHLDENFIRLVKERVGIDFTNVKTPELDYVSIRRGKKLKSDPFTAPFVHVKAQAGYVKAIDQEVYMETLEKYALPPGVNPQGAIWRYWEIEGDSMEPEFNSGDIILTSQVPYEDWSNLRNFYLYVVVTTERVIFKRLFCKNELEWVLISVNEENYPQQLIQISDIKEVWVFRRSILNKAPTTKVYDIKV